tara:strand:+ start:1973 stop:2317 length:345 start_codon:yes stop_codon:yes gene_type:complete
MKNAVTVGQLLNEKLREQNISIKRLVDETNLNKAVVYGILKDERGITAYTALALERVLKWPAMEWLTHQAWYDLVREKYIQEQTERGIDHHIAKEMFYEKRKTLVKCSMMNTNQ